MVNADLYCRLACAFALVSLNSSAYPLPATTTRAEGGVTMHIPFDGSANASFSNGKAEPVAAAGLEYGPGKFGGAVRLSAQSGSILAYAAQGNIDLQRGSMDFWLKREATAAARPQGLLALEKGQEPGCGRFSFALRDDGRSVATRDEAGGRASSGKISPWPEELGVWEHWIISWGMRPGSLAIYRGGDGTREFRPYRNEDQCMRILASKIAGRPTFVENAPAPERFFLGCGEGDTLPIEGWIDEVRISSREIDAEMAREIFKRDRVAKIVSMRHYGTEGDKRELRLELDLRDASSRKTAVELVDAAGTVLERSGLDGGGSGVILKADIPVGQYECRLVGDNGTILAREPYTVLRGGNPYELPSTDHPGEPRELRFVKSVKPDLAALSTNDFRAVGQCRMATLAGETYLEGGPGDKDRFAIRFSLPTNVPLYLLDIVYPDDKFRSMDLVVQPTGGGDLSYSHASHGGGEDYAMAQGIATGGEYPCTMRMLHHRCLYWTGRSEDMALVAMSWQPDAPAAISRMDIYEVVDCALPVAAITPPKGVGETGRQIGQFWEDPALAGALRFAMDNPADFAEQIDRYAAVMRYCGQNLLCYPGAWYRGLIDASNDARPGTHADHFLEGYYAKFEREGLFVMPNIEFIFPLRPPEVDPTFEMVSNGLFHSSPYPIRSDGLPPQRFSHGLPPMANFFHPEVQREIEEMVRTLAREGAPYQSFTGIALQLYKDGACWWGDITSGYNDYCIEAFERDTGIAIPVNRQDPLRGKAYHEWLMANCREAWLDWRCDKFSEFWAKMAAVLRETRHDLRLQFIVGGNADAITNLKENPDYFDEDFASRTLREAGFDGAKLAAAVPNAIFSATIHPMRHRKRWYWLKTPEKRKRYISIQANEGWYRQIAKGDWPAVTLRDEFMEYGVKHFAPNSPETLTGGWLREIGWRCSTINASGVNAMRYWTVPMRYCDVLCILRGGFLVCDYGWEPFEARFAQAFRALPAVKFDDLPCGEFVKLRQKDVGGRSWFYVVNTDGEPHDVRIFFPEGTVSLTSNEMFSGETSLALDSYSIRSFYAPEGSTPILLWAP